MSDDVAVVHLVTPASKMSDLLLGSKKKVKAMCGEWVTKAPEGDLPVCRPCFERMLDEDKIADAEGASG